MRKNNKALTLIELLVVIMVIGGVLAVSVPLCRRLFISSNETDAIVSLGKLSAAMEVYRTLYKTYPDNLTNLAIVNPTLSAGPLLSSGAKGGYKFRLESSTFSRNTYELIAEPKVSGTTGKNTFKIDQTGNIYRQDAITTTVWSIINPEPGVSPTNPGSGGRNN